MSDWETWRGVAILKSDMNLFLVTSVTHWILVYLSFTDQLLHGKSEGTDPSDVPPVALQKDMTAANILECETIEEEEDESCDYIESYDEQKWSVMENIFTISKSGISHQAKKLDCSKRPFGKCALRFTFLKLLEVSRVSTLATKVISKL